jgi:hypothetical protein
VAAATSSVTRDWTRSFPFKHSDDRAQLNWRASIGEFALESHLDRDGAFLEVVEREAGEKRVGRKAIRVDHPPRCRSEDTISAPVCAVTSSAWFASHTFGCAGSVRI